MFARTARGAHAQGRRERRISELNGSTDSSPRASYQRSYRTRRSEVQTAAPVRRHGRGPRCCRRLPSGGSPRPASSPAPAGPLTTDPPPPPRPQVEILMADLPGALALLEEAGHVDTVPFLFLPLGA